MLQITHIMVICCFESVFTSPENSILQFYETSLNEIVVNTTYNSKVDAKCPRVQRGQCFVCLTHQILCFRIKSVTHKVTVGEFRCHRAGHGPTELRLGHVKYIFNKNDFVFWDVLDLYTDTRLVVHVFVTGLNKGYVSA